MPSSSNRGHTGDPSTISGIRAMARCRSAMTESDLVPPRGRPDTVAAHGEICVGPYCLRHTDRAAPNGTGRHQRPGGDACFLTWGIKTRCVSIVVSIHCCQHCCHCCYLIDGESARSNAQSATDAITAFYLAALAHSHR